MKIKSFLLNAVVLFFLPGLSFLVNAQTPPDLTVIDNYTNPTSGNTCGIDGNPNSGTAKKASNRLKNRFEIPSDLQAMSLEEIKDLPPDTDGNPPSIDSQKQMRPVTVVGYVVAVTAGGRGESCNCKATGFNQRDAHIDLVLYPNEEMADTLRRDFVVAEVTERSRRLASGGFLTSNIGKDWSTNMLKDKIKGRWVKFTGYMFYDDDHHDESWSVDPDNNTGRSNWRATGWEIHPVMGIEVLPGRPAGIAAHKPNFNPDHHFVLAPSHRRRNRRNRNR